MTLKFKQILYILLIFTLITPLIKVSGQEAIPSFTKELIEGDSGKDVLSLKKRLQTLGYLDSKPDEIFDFETAEALKKFQKHNNLLITGTLDKYTYEILYSDNALYLSSHYKNSELELIDGFFPSFGHYNQIIFNTDEYSSFSDNVFHSVRISPLSTFAADVDTASYSKIRSFILEERPVPPDSVRIEEMLNYFNYDYEQPKENEPFGVTIEKGPTPWNLDTELLLIGIKAQDIKIEDRPPQNLVFLIDVSGSMDSPDRLPLAKRAFGLLVETLDPKDKISIVTYASYDEILLDGVPASEKTTIMAAIDSLLAGGATAGAAGTNSAYELAEKHYISGGNNRVILATDGDLNVGVSDEGSLIRLVEEKKKNGVFLSVLGFGYGNYKDNKLEALADKGDGNYHFISNIFEARKVLVTEGGSNFFAVAKDVKLQIDFNSTYIKGYRLIGYENRLLQPEEFIDDTKDGGELGSGHSITVLYEIVPVDSKYEIDEVTSKYQIQNGSDIFNKEMLTLSIRAKSPDEDKSNLYEYPLLYDSNFVMTDNFLFAAAVAEFGMILKEDKLKGTASYDDVLDLLRQCESLLGDPYKEEFLYLVTLLTREQELNN